LLLAFHNYLESMGFLYSKCTLMFVIPLLVIVLLVKTEHIHRYSAVCINLHGATFQKTGMFISTAVPASNSVGGNPSPVEFYVYGSVNRWSILIIVHRDVTKSSLFIIIQVQSTCFGCQPHQSVTTDSGTGHIFCAGTAFQRDQASCTKNITSTGGCSYSFVYSWWSEWLAPETCTVNLQNNK